MNPGSDQDYLWNRQGRDAEIERLEALFAPLRADVALSAPRARAHRPRRPRGWGSVAAAASLAVVMLCWTALGWRLSWPDARAWPVQASHGPVWLDERPLHAGAALGPGSELRTGADAVASIRIARIGHARLGPGSRLRIERTRTGEHRVALAEGSLWVRVWAPPGHFGVRLAQSDVVDLGCEFALHAMADGSGLLAVRSGWVMVVAGVHEVLVPAGAQVALAAGGVPATPHDDQASAAFIDALRVADAQGAKLDPTGTEVRRLLAAARREDAISLLSLLGRHRHLASGPLFDHLQAQWPGAGPVDRAAVSNGSATALEPWWRALPYPRAKQWWLHWRDALPATRPGHPLPEGRDDTTQRG